MRVSQEREEKEKKAHGSEKKQRAEPPSIYNDKGEIRQCNQGRYPFALDQSSEPDKIILEIEAPRYLCTSAIDVDVHPDYVRCTIKGKVTQLRLPAEVLVDESQVQRSKATGHLRIVMPLVNPPPRALRKMTATSAQKSTYEAASQEPSSRSRCSTAQCDSDHVTVADMLNVTGKAVQHMSERQKERFSVETELRAVSRKASSQRGPGASTQENELNELGGDSTGCVSNRVGLEGNEENASKSNRHPLLGSRDGTESRQTAVPAVDDDDLPELEFVC
ncbi:hypothetical protein BESB_082080 [Besnoitia besnoiti]|uniref:Dynein axonemal assembly factor 11-like CS domain-containing protein n=1 Tax=Besnoitia besnoiti TaxID=94643 RepID=A0A2A9M4Y4_BESBE|nr:hypothetical protein BESB_082080 [Besnoitia besnoiti]PFH33009.1 hypothetical protein BESB_082080 [Besnoitia besnoiti]